MAIYRSQKPSWEASLKNHTKPTLLTTSTPALSSLDLTAVSLTGVRKSVKPKTLGLAATIRNARAERGQEALRAMGKDKGMGEEEVEDRRERKRKREEDDGLVLGFDFEPVTKVVVQAVVSVVKKVGKTGDGEKKVRKIRKVPGVKGAGKDESKRPKSTDGWWVE